MFSGIISDVGRIVESVDRNGGLRLTISAVTLDLEDVQIGDSIAVNGICLTVIERSVDRFTLDVSRETLDCTVGLDDPGQMVNLEKALRLADRLGGHLVSGHVDGIGLVETFTNLGESWKLTVQVPQALAKYIAHKGSVAINGVSLTVNQVSGTKFSVNLIPHTLAQTNLKSLQAGNRVNIEVDLIARYLERMMQAEKEQSK